MVDLLCIICNSSGRRCPTKFLALPGTFLLKTLFSLYSLFSYFLLFQFGQFSWFYHSLRNSLFLGSFIYFMGRLLVSVRCLGRPEGNGCTGEKSRAPVILFTVRSLLTLLTILTDNAASCLERRKTKIVMVENFARLNNNNQLDNPINTLPLLNNTNIFVVTYLL